MLSISLLKYDGIMFIVYASYSIAKSNGHFSLMYLCNTLKAQLEASPFTVQSGSSTMIGLLEDCRVVCKNFLQP
jgi:hypothetical protein